MNYSNMKYNELLKLCKERNIHGYSHKKKARLIELLEENDWIFLSTKHDAVLTTHDIFKPWHDFYRTVYDGYNKTCYKVVITDILQTYHNVLLNERGSDSMILHFVLSCE